MGSHLAVTMDLKFVWSGLISIPKAPVVLSRPGPTDRALEGRGPGTDLPLQLSLGVFGQPFLLGASTDPPVPCGYKYLLRIILAAVKCPGIFE